jgi:hypothetical protein
LAGNRRGRQSDTEIIHHGEERPQPNKTRRGATKRSCGPPEEAGEADGYRKATRGVTFTITVRRVRIDPEEKRADLLTRLEVMMKDLNNLISRPSTIKTNRLKAMDVMIRTIKATYTIVRDIDVELMENEIEKLKASTEDPEIDFAPLDDPEDPG